jgi:hypothetical protein
MFITINKGMKRLMLVLITLLISLSKANSQGKTVFMIAGQGCPANCSNEFNPHYPVHLFKVKDKRLEKVYDISLGDIDVFKIAQYNTFKKVIIYESEFFVKKKSFLIIDFNNQIRIDTIVRKFRDETFSDFTYYLVYYKGYYYVIFRHCDDTNKDWDSRKYYYYAINLSTQTDTIFDNSIIQYLHSEGVQGMSFINSVYDQEEVLNIRTRVVNGNPIHLILYPRLLGSIDTAIFKIPKLEELSKRYIYINFNLKTTELIVLPIVNENIICVPTSIDLDENKFLGTTYLQIYKAQYDRWDSARFAGMYDYALRHINDWIVGYEAYSYSLGYYQKMERYGAPSGAKFRQNDTIYGIPFDERIKQNKVYPEGRLFIYNIHTGKYIEWEAIENGIRQADSEVLYIEGEEVYYRINDKIYKSKIINGEKIGTPELLVQDRRITEVHWLFLAEE